MPSLKMRWYFISHAWSSRLFYTIKGTVLLKLSQHILKFEHTLCYLEGEEGNNIEDWSNQKYHINSITITLFSF